MHGNNSGNFSDLDGDLQGSTPSQGSRATPPMVAATVIVGAAGVVGNLLVVIVFMKYKKLFQNIKTTFIVNQSVLDGTVSLLIILATLVTTEPHGGDLAMTLHCKLWISQVSVWGLLTSSTYNLMAISIERYLAVVHPVWHKVSFTNTRAYIIAIIIWVFGLVFFASYVIPTTAVLYGRCLVTYVFPSREIANAVAYVQIFVNMVMPIVVHSFCYARILSALRNRMTRVSPKSDTTSTTQREKTCTTIAATPATKAGAIHTLGCESESPRGAVNLPSTSGTNVITNLTPIDSTDLATRSSNKQPNSFETRNDKAKGNVVKTLAIVTVSYFVCWIPNKIYIILYLLGTVSTFNEVYNATVILVFINCCINPIIYIGKYDAFKTGLSMLFKG